MGGPLTRRQVLAGTGVLVLAAALAGPAAGGSAEVTRGDFHAFAAGAGMGIYGHAQMVRTADGRTFVSVHVTGLAPNTTYGAHVHKAACGAGDADGIGNGKAWNEGTAGAAALAVVVHAPGGAKIACADLE